MYIKLNLTDITKRRTENILSIFDTVRSSVQDVYNVPVQKKSKKAIKEIIKHAELQTLTPDSISVTQGHRKFVLSSGMPGELKLLVRNLNWKRIEKDLVIKNSNIVSLKGYKPEHHILNDYLNEIFDMFDDKLFQLRKMFLNDRFVKFIESFKAPISLNASDKQIAVDIRKLFKQIDSKITSITCPATRSSVKNGFDGIAKGKQGSKQIEFLNINGKDYWVNLLLDDNKKHNLIIGVKDQQLGKNFHIILEQDGDVVFKSKRINKTCKIGDKIEYYSEKDMKSPEFSEALYAVRKGLLNYDKYIDEKLKYLDDFRYKYTTTDVGVIKDEKMEQIKVLQDMNKKLRAAFKDLRKQAREIAREKLSVQLMPSINYSTILKKVGPYKEIVHLSFPVVYGKQCTKVLILNRNNKVEKTYFIRDNKLVKFNAVDTSKSKVGQSVFHYHTQEEIDNSSLYTYLDEIQTRLNEILQQTQGKGWYKNSN